MEGLACESRLGIHKRLHDLLHQKRYGRQGAALLCAGPDVHLASNRRLDLIGCVWADLSGDVRFWHKNAQQLTVMSSSIVFAAQERVRPSVLALPAL
jgi:hypothetical protein